MKKGWEIKRLDEVCDEIFAGGDVPKNSFSKTKTDKYFIPIFSNGEKNKGLYGYTNVARVTVPSITISARGTIGYSEIREESFYPAIRLIVVSPNKDILNLPFLQYAIQGIDFSHSGSSIPQLTVPMISGYPIPVPPLSEQQRIVSVLDEAFASIAQAKANAERNLVNARELFESVLANMYESAGTHWEEKNLGAIASEMQTGPFGSTLHKSDYVANGIPVINPQNLVDGKIVPLQKMMVNQKTKERLSRYILQEKDIVLARRGEMGRCAIVEKEQAGWLCGSGSFVVRIKKEVNANYLVRYLSSAKVKRILQKGSVGTTMDNLNQGILSQVPVPFPPLAEQRAIVERLEALSAETRRLEGIYQSKLDTLDELKKSVLEKAFEGEL